MDNNIFIYIIEATKGSKAKYVGQTKNGIASKEQLHLNYLKENKHPSKKLQRYFNKNGSNSLKFYKIMDCTEDRLNFWQDWWIKRLNSKEKGFNYSNICL